MGARKVILPDSLFLVDLAMLAVTGGQERTVSEHRELLTGTGFRLERIIPTRNELMIIEATSA